MIYSTIGRLLLAGLLVLVARPAAAAAAAGGGFELGGTAVLRDCEPRPDAASLGTTLPLGLLDYLERVSSSAFVHAFLLAHVAESGNAEHWLTRCARAFLATPATDAATLRAHRVSAGTLIRTLRAAELARQEDQQIRAASQLTISTIVPELRRDLSLPNVEAHAPYFQRALATGCTPGPAPVCRPLRSTVDRMDEVRWSHQAVEMATAASDQLAEEAQRQAAELQALGDVVAADSVALQQLLEAAGEATEADTVELRHREQLLTTRRMLRDSLVQEHALTRASADSATVALRAAGAAVAGSTAALRQQLVELDGALRTAAGTPLAAERIDLPPREPVRTRLGLAETVPAAAWEPRPTGGRSLNLFAELTDFVIDRARQEMVLTYLSGLYSTMRRDALLQSAFPETFRLMRGLAAADPSRGLSAVDAGRVPLNVWRATLATDYTRLPISLVQGSPLLLCGDNAACAGRVALLQPLAQVSHRLLAGDPAFDVLREAPLAALRPAQGAGAEWTAVGQGIAVVAALAEAYQVQGIGLTADPARHPYVLSSSALATATAEQRDAFLRLLVVRTAPAPAGLAVGAAPGAAGGNTAALLEAVRRSVAAMESLAATQLVAESNAPQAGSQAVRSALAAMAGAVDVGAALAPDAEAVRGVAIVRQQWSDFGAAVSPLVSGDYGLALSRSTVLLRGLTDQPLPRNMLTLAALGSGLAEARTGAQVRAAFEAATSPAGGWQAKRYREGARTTITAYPGLAGGAEWLVEGGAMAPTVGVSLPIGAEVQLLRRRDSAATGSPGCLLGICSVGIFVPVVDAGALLSYRIENSDEVSSTPNSSLRQIFAPGAYLSFGVGRSAFSLLAGGQFMPAIRKLNTEGGEAGAHAFRVGGAIVLDVSLFEFR